MSLFPRSFGYELDASHPIVSRARDIFVIGDGRYTVPGRKNGSILARNGAPTFQNGMLGGEVAGTGSASLTQAFSPTLNGLRAAFGGIVARRGTKNASSGLESLISLGDGGTASGGIWASIALDDGTAYPSIGTGKLGLNVRFMNGSEAVSIVGPTMNTDGVPHACAALITRASTNQARIWFWVDGVLYGSSGDATTSTTDVYGYFSVGSTNRFGTHSSYMAAGSSVSLAWYGTTDSANHNSTTEADKRYGDWTKNPFGIFRQPKRRYWWPSTGDGGATISASLTASLALESSISAAVSAKKATLELKNGAGFPAANRSNLKWAWWDVITPDLITTAPTDKGAALTTDGSGICEVPLVNSVKTSGQVGWLIITDSDGDINQAPGHSAFTGPIAVD